MRTFVAIVVGCFVLAAPAQAELSIVEMHHSSFAPPRLDVLVGDAVRWQNGSLRAHEVRSDAAGFDSGRLAPGAGFSRVFDTAGHYPYVCTLHDFMNGEVGVHALLLRGPRTAVDPGSRVVLEGRSAVGRDPVTIEVDTGSGWRAVATAPVTAAGTFTAELTAESNAVYRALAGGQASPPTQVEVADHTRLRLRASRRGRMAVLRVSASPPRPGALVVLQLRLRERFGWWPFARARLDRRSVARFTVRRQWAPARAVLTKADGTTVITASETVRLRPSRHRRHY